MYKFSYERHNNLSTSRFAGNVPLMDTEERTEKVLGGDGARLKK